MTVQSEDEKKKSSVCIPLDIPETPEDYFLAVQSNTKVEDLLRSELGLFWMRSRRCYDVHHFSLTQLVSFFWIVFNKVGAFNRKIDLCADKVRETTH